MLHDINIDLNYLIHDFIEVKYYISIALRCFNLNQDKVL